MDSQQSSAGERDWHVDCRLTTGLSTSTGDWTGEQQTDWRLLTDTVLVTAAVIERDGSFLVTRRPDGTHLAGLWEFPGGKCREGESLPACLEREIREELDAAVVVGPEILRTVHRYPGQTVELRFFSCTLSGNPRPMIGQELRWVHRTQLGRLSFPPADKELIEKLVRQ